MPKKPAEPEVQESTVPKIDPQKQYLMDQFGNLMEQVGDGFGGPLQEELISRLEQTIADFHEEVNEMLGRLKDNSEKRHEKLKEISNNNEITKLLNKDVLLAKKLNINGTPAFVINGEVLTGWIGKSSFSRLINQQ